MSSTSNTPFNSSSRIRQRPLHLDVSRTLAVVVVFVAASLLPSFTTPALAFYPPVLAVTSKALLNGNGNIGSSVHDVGSNNNNQYHQYVKHPTMVMPKYNNKQSWTVMDQAASSSEEELRRKDASKWLTWLKFGNRRQVGDIRMREAPELGGVARSDRYSSSDWLHNTMSLPNSAILRAIRGPVMFMTCWAGFLSILHRRLLLTHPVAAELMSIPQVPHSLMVSALSLLLVFKTNSAYQRFAEGRKIWETIINASRDLYRLMNLYEMEMGRSKRRRLQRLLAAFPYLLRHRIRPNLVMYRLDDEENVRNPEHSIVLYQDKAANDLDPEAAAVATIEENEGKSRRKTRPLYWVDKRTLPWRLLPPNALEPCARAQNRPLWVCDRMAQELKNIPDGPFFTARERMALIAKVDKLSGCIGACERIHQTAVPLNYARHSLRALTLWLFTLPFCLVSSLKLFTAPALFLVSWLMFGVYEIGYSIEDPFQGTLRLSVLCDTIRRDVLADEVTRSTAFEVPDDEQPPSNVGATAQTDGTDSKVSGSSTFFDGGDTSSIVEEEERDYESSPVIKPLQVVKIAEVSSDEVAPVGPTSSTMKNDSKAPVVEELPTLPVTFNGKTASEMTPQDMDTAITDLMSKKP